MNEQTLYHYDEAMLPRTFTICGITLKPFCMGHLLLLERLKSPLLNQEVSDVPMTDGIQHFMIALTICALSYENGLKLIDDEEYRKEITTVINEAIQNNMKVEKDWNIYHKLNMFVLYMKYFFDMPIYSVEQKSDKRGKTGLDWKIGVGQVLKKLGYDESEIMNMNMKRVFYEWCQEAENNGAIKVINANQAKPATIVVGEPTIG